MQLVPSSTRATDLRVRPCAPDVGGEEITWPSVILVDLDPHPAPTPLNSTVSISETRLSYLSNLKCDNLYLNNGNISGINYVNVNNLVADGKNQRK